MMFGYDVYCVLYMLESLKGYVAALTGYDGETKTALSLNGRVFILILNFCHYSAKSGLDGLDF